jgi:hypothetical protein
MNFLDGEDIIDCDLYNQLPGLFANCEITGVTSFKNLITSDTDGHSFFTRRYKRK